MPKPASKKFEATPALRRLYQEAWNTKGIWLREYGQNNNGLCVALAGTKKRLEALERELGREIEWPEFQYGDGIAIGAEVGRGQSRIVACRRAVKAVLVKIGQEAN